MIAAILGDDGDTRRSLNRDAAIQGASLFLSTGQDWRAFRFYVPVARHARHFAPSLPMAPSNERCGAETGVPGRVRRTVGRRLARFLGQRVRATKIPAQESLRGEKRAWGVGGQNKRAERSNTPSGFLFDRSTRKKMHGRKATSWKRVQIVLFNLERRDSGDRTPKEAITPRLVRKRFALGPFAPTLRRLTRAPSMRRKSVSARRSG
jgi:hypothetical protein